MTIIISFGNPGNKIADDSNINWINYPLYDLFLIIQLIEEFSYLLRYDCTLKKNQ